MPVPKYTIDAAHVRMSPEEIVALLKSPRVQNSTIAVFGEVWSIARYLPLVVAQTEFPHVRWRPEVLDQWRVYGDADLREDMRHYREWWRQKVEDGRGISVHRGKEQFLLRMALAGMPEWEAIWDQDGGWYQEDAYNAVGHLFGWEPVVGYREESE